MINAASPFLSSSPSQAEPRPPALAPDVSDRLAHLFRASLRSGLVHPLYLPIVKYRHTQQAQP